MTLSWFRALVLVGLAGYAALFYYGTLRPFNFSWDARAHAGTLAEPEWIPFTWICPIHGYEFHPRNTAINLAAFIPMGFLLGICLPAASRKRHGVRLAAGFCLTLSVFAEVAQYFLPSRFPSASDLLLNSLSGAIGMWCFMYVVARYPMLAALFLRPAIEVDDDRGRILDGR